MEAVTGRAKGVREAATERDLRARVRVTEGEAATEAATGTVPAGTRSTAWAPVTGAVTVPEPVLAGSDTDPAETMRTATVTAAAREPVSAVKEAAAVAVAAVAATAATDPDTAAGSGSAAGSGTVAGSGTTAGSVTAAGSATAVGSVTAEGPAMAAEPATAVGSVTAVAAAAAAVTDSDTAAVTAAGLAAIMVSSHIITSRNSSTDTWASASAASAVRYQCSANDVATTAVTHAVLEQFSSGPRALLYHYNTDQIELIIRM